MARAATGQGIVKKGTVPFSPTFARPALRMARIAAIPAWKPSDIYVQAEGSGLSPELTSLLDSSSVVGGQDSRHAPTMSEDAPLDGPPAEDTPPASIDAWLRQLASDMPGTVKFRLLNTLEHLDRAFKLLDVDREMASFRAITAEEEGATTLIKAIQLRGYPQAKQFDARDHQHKAAVIACVKAVATQLEPILKEFELSFDFTKRRADVRIPLSNFNVNRGEHFAIQPVEPLDFVHKSEGKSEAAFFDEALAHLAARSNFESIKRMVSAQANARNTLLYASDSALPRSRASRDAIENRKTWALALLVLSVMVLQSRKHQSLVCQAILAFLGVISRLPREEISEGAVA
jgi:hypothetical protein